MRKRGPHPHQMRLPLAEEPRPFEPPRAEPGPQPGFPHPGECVTWLHERRGGWGYVLRVPAVVIRSGRRRVLILVERRNGRQAERWVSRERLQPGAPRE